MLRVQNIVKSLYYTEQREQAEATIKTDTLFADTNHNKGMVHARFLEYDKALEFMKQAKEENPENLNILRDLYLLYTKTGAIKEAVDIAEEIFVLRKAKYKDEPNHTEVATSNNNLGIAYMHKGEYDQAIKYYKQALEIYKIAYGPNHHAIAMNYNSLGATYSDKGEYDQAIENYNKALEIYIDYKSSSNHSDIAASYNNLGSAYRNKGEYGQAITYYEQVLEIHRIVYKSSPNHPDIAASYNSLGNAYKDKGEYDQAITYYEQALKIYKVVYASNPNHHVIAMNYNGLGTTYFDKGEYDQAITCCEQALKIYKVVYASNNSNHPGIARSYNNLGNAYSNKGEYEQAIENYNKALEIYEVAYHPNHPSIAATCNNLGATYRNKGEYEQAIENYNKALKIYKVVYAGNPNHFNIASICNNLGVAYYAKEEYGQAIKYYKQALEIYKIAYASNPDHPYIAGSYNNLGNACSDKREYGQAIKYYKQALEIYKIAYETNPNHPTIAAICNNLGTTCSDKGEYDQAITYYEQALKIYKVVYASNPNHSTIAAIYNNLGTTCSDKGEYGQAITYYKQALEIYKIAYASNPDHPYIASSYNNLGNAYSNKGEYEQAHSYAQKSLEIFLKCQNPQYLSKAKTLYNISLLQLGNLALLEDDIAKAREYYKQIEAEYEQIDLNSEEFIQLQLRKGSIAYENNFLLAAINCQLVLIKVDPELKYGNHYHNLACFCACQGNIEGANEAFIKALTHPQVTGSLHAEYAQFLILNMNFLIIDPQEISKHLYAAIESKNIGGLQYGKIEQTSVCNVLQELIKQKNATINVDPKVLAYYLLATRSQFLIKDDKIEELLDSFYNYCNNMQDELSFKLLSYTYASASNEELALKYSKQAELIGQIDDIISNKAPISTNNIDFEAVEGYASTLDILTSKAIFESRLQDVSRFLTKVFQIYNAVLVENPGQLQLAANKLATFNLLTNNLQQFVALKFNYGTELNQDLIKLLGQDVETVIGIEEQIIAQVTISLQQQNIETTNSNEALETEVSSLGDNEIGPWTI